MADVCVMWRRCSCGCHLHAVCSCSTCEACFEQCLYSYRARVSPGKPLHQVHALIESKMACVDGTAYSARQEAQLKRSQVKYVNAHSHSYGHAHREL